MPLQRSSNGRGRTGLSRALDGRTLVGRLFDTYADLLTPRQREMLRMYYHNDLSLGEIAARCRVTRQAIFDSLRRSVAELRSLEQRIGVVAERERRTRARAAAMERLVAAEREVARLSASGHAGLGGLRGTLRALRARL